MNKKLLALVLASAMVFAMAGCGSSDSSDSGSSTETSSDTADSSDDSDTSASDGEVTGISAKVALITMDQIDVHWVRLEAAAEERIAELNAEGNDIELTWLAPETKDNAQQIQKIETAVADNADYIIIACNDSTSCNVALQEALDAGIQLIYVDSPADLEGSATFMTDNYEGGVQAGEYLLQVLTDAGLTEGTIGIVDAQSGVQSCQDRYDGFASVFADTDFTLSERQYSEGDATKAQEMANTLINNGCIALYGTNDGATNGAASATMDAQNNGMTVYTVGWDKSDTNVARVEDGSLLAFMAQNPDVMGSEAIDAVYALACGEDLGGEVVDTGVTVVTIDNIEEFKD